MSVKCYVIKVFWITELKCKIAYPLIHRILLLSDMCTPWYIHILKCMQGYIGA